MEVWCWKVKTVICLFYVMSMPNENAFDDFQIVVHSKPAVAKERPFWDVLNTYVF